MRWSYSWVNKIEVIPNYPSETRQTTVYGFLPIVRTTEE